MPSMEVTNGLDDIYCTYACIQVLQSVIWLEKGIICIGSHLPCNLFEAFRLLHLALCIAYVFSTQIDHSHDKCNDGQETE
jgi:hypothetical protein